MTDPKRPLSDIEEFLADADSESKEDVVAGLRAGKVDTKQFFEHVLPPEPQLYNEFHALLVELGKRHCRRRARCEGCPLASLAHEAGL